MNGRRREKGKGREEETERETERGKEREEFVNQGSDVRKMSVKI